MFVKICGITNEEDALMATALGADAVGFVFAPSARQVSVGTVRDIVKRLPPEIVTVGVFRDQAPQLVIDTVLATGLRAAQLHGHESPQDAAEIRPYVQALIVGLAVGDPALAHVDSYGADALLLDSPVPGSGKVFDWALAEGVPVGRRMILAGGLTPENVGDAVREVQPWGVDTSTGVQADGDPLRKDPLKVQRFVRNARAAAPQPYHPEGHGPFDWADAGL
ncbi:phosphoribosylanthranilate isomerase [Dermatobacter hominis]|uniref:phosphoribosylanthranilate isomerase n=1 Tax=Dermatobacter hominis TaxID=2884263 RepID=UPI001D12CA8E|nr:phosphoribosylanthranilate isomerase [Dermatobacter hominis]UDY36043.1 phosphoribosylanthranilate isomerase [Dermatobacter hominis]